jgi:hypothetical protein
MTKYDDYDYHVGEAVANGQPEDNGFTHIGFMFAWLIRRGFGNAETFGDEIVRQIEGGSLRPNDLRDLTDGKLISDMLEPEGSAFLDSYYMPGYGADYEAEFADSPGYRVEDDPENEARIDGRIDAAYAQWVASGRPRPTTDGLSGMLIEIQKSIETGSPIPGEFMAKLGELGIQTPPIEDIVFEYSGPEELIPNLPVLPGVTIRRIEHVVPHLNPELEARAEAAIGKPMNMESMAMSQLGAATLNRALRNLGVRGNDALLVSGMGKVKAEPTIQVFSIAGIGRDALTPEFKRYLENLVRGKWHDCQVGDVAGRSCKVKFAEPTNLLWFAVDGYVAYLCTKDDQAINDMAFSLLETLRA